jgi:uncharacterized membrane protein
MHMIRDFIAAVAISTIILVSLKLIVGLTVPVDLLIGRMYLMPMIIFNALTDIFSLIVERFPVILLIYVTSLSAAAIHSLMKLD